MTGVTVSLRLPAAGFSRRYFTLLILLVLSRERRFDWGLATLCVALAAAPVRKDGRSTR